MGKELKRMRYFDGLFLRADDYNLDKELHRRLRWLHNRWLHTWGIAYGLEVKKSTDSNMEVAVTEGVALDCVEVEDPQTGISESVSREIVIYTGHPDNPVDLSEYWREENDQTTQDLAEYWKEESKDNGTDFWEYWVEDTSSSPSRYKVVENKECIPKYKVAKNIYISVSYEETPADRDRERGQGEEIHLWEKGRISHSVKKPQDPKKDIILARVVPKAVPENITEQDGSIKVILEPVIDSTCIFSTDCDGSELRTNAQPAGRMLGLGKFIFKLGESKEGMPYLGFSSVKGIVVGSIRKSSQDPSEEPEGPPVKLKSKSPIHIQGNLILSGELTLKPEEDNWSNSKVPDQFLKLNKSSGSNLKKQDGGLEVYRGGAGVAPDARIIWSEAQGCWKAGLGNDLWRLPYGENWDRLIQGGYADDLHRHDRLYSLKGVAISADSSGSLSVKGDLAMKMENVVNIVSGDRYAGIGWYGVETVQQDGKPVEYQKSFADLKVGGPVLSGPDGGVLGTTLNGQKIALSWNSRGNVGIGTGNPESTGIEMVTPKADKLDVGGSLRILTGFNPVRFTSGWTGFPDAAINQAEISNDTSAYKTLMIVGNQSSGQGRKVAVWDRLDINGFLNAEGSMAVSQALTPSAGSGNNGIIFPRDPGGGSGDAAWIKYYPRSGESCTLEIGTSNDWDDNIMLTTSGNVGVGGLDPEHQYIPVEKLDVTGNLRVLSGSNPIQFNSSHTGFPNNASNRAEFSNDTATYKTLMILGNKSAGMGRRVSIGVPDGVPNRLEVHGHLQVNGNLRANRAIMPSVANSEARGILFPKDPYGGSGDAAWIRYYSRDGLENMTLEIGVANDSNIQWVEGRCWVSTCPWNYGCGYWYYYRYSIDNHGGDRLSLNASGGVYINGYLYQASSRDYKENINKFPCGQPAQELLQSLEPVTFNYKGGTEKTTLGFIAEDVPVIFAAHDQKAISPFEIIALLVSEVKEQEKDITKLKKQVNSIKNKRNN